MSIRPTYSSATSTSSRIDATTVKAALAKLAGETFACPRCRIVETKSGSVTTCHVCQEPGLAETFVEDGGHQYCSPRCYGRRG